MAYTEWSMQGIEVTSCNCNWACPCQFNSLASHGHCRAHCFVEIQNGGFGDIPLDGLRCGATASFASP